MKNRIFLLSSILFSASTLPLLSQVPQSPQIAGPPADLVKSLTVGNAAKAYYGDLSRAWYDWETLTKTVVIKRRERESATAPWFEQAQEVTTAYYVVDVRATCSAQYKITRLYIAGLYPNGDACIEQWAFTYPPYPQPVSGYVPIDQRPMPRVRKAELFRGPQFGSIRCLEPDPDGRFLLFITREQPLLHRLSLPAGTITEELTQATTPQLADVHSIYAAQHVSAGRQFHLFRATRWEADLTETRVIIVLDDPDNDGAFDGPRILTPTQWSQLDYDSLASWESFCQ